MQPESESPDFTSLVPLAGFIPEYYGYEPLEAVTVLSQAQCLASSLPPARWQLVCTIGRWSLSSFPPREGFPEGDILGFLAMVLPLLEGLSDESCPVAMRLLLDGSELTLAEILETAALL